MTLVPKPPFGAPAEGVHARTLCGSVKDPERTLAPILNLQKQLLYDPTRYASGDAFLISAFDLQELNGLLENGAALILLERENELMGYSLIAPIEEFTTLYAPGSGDKFLPTTTFSIEKTDYLYQIAVAPKHTRKGFGYRLLELAKAHSQSGLLADILVQPLENSASVRFFEKNGFAECGTLILANYRDFGKLQSKVYLWTPSKMEATIQRAETP